MAFASGMYRSSQRAGGKSGRGGRAAIRREIRRAGREREREGRNGGYEKFSLQAAGIGPGTAAPVNVNVEVRAGWVIDLSEPDRPMKIVGGAAKVIDAKPSE